MTRRCLWMLLCLLWLPPPAVPADGVDRSRLSKTLHLYNWTDYLAPQILKDFQREYGVRVIEDKYASNEELVAKIQTGASGYDLAVPSDYTVRRLIREKLLLPIDHRHLPNLKHLDPRFRRPPYDPGLTYSIPYLWGTTGIGYNRKAFGANPPGSWADLFEPARLAPHRGRVSMLNDMREVIGAALIYRGHSPNTTNPKALAEAREVLLRQKPFLAKYDSEAYKQSLAAGETVIGHGWSGEILSLRRTHPGIAYVIPREGTFLFVDNLVIPRGARHRYTAEVFMNYLLRPDVAARNASYLRYPTPNLSARSLIRPPLEGASDSPPRGVRLYSLEDLGEGGKLYEKLWTELKAR